MNSFDTQLHPEDNSAILAYEDSAKLSLRERIAAMPQYPDFYTKDGELTNTNKLLSDALDAFSEAFCLKVKGRPVSLKRLEERHNARERAWFDALDKELEEQAEREERDDRLALYASQEVIEYEKNRQDLIDANYVAFGRMLELAEETGRTL